MLWVSAEGKTWYLLCPICLFLSTASFSIPLKFDMQLNNHKNKEYKSLLSHLCLILTPRLNVRDVYFPDTSIVTETGGHPRTLNTLRKIKNMTCRRKHTLRGKKRTAHRSVNSAKTKGILTTWRTQTGGHPQTLDTQMEVKNMTHGRTHTLRGKKHGTVDSTKTKGIYVGINRCKILTGRD